MTPVGGATWQSLEKYFNKTLFNRPYVKKSQNDGIAILDFRLIT